MDEERGEEPQRWFKRQRESLCQSARYELETSPAGRRLKERVVLRPYGGSQKEKYEYEDSK
jgi:hypothetical protein